MLIPVPLDPPIGMLTPFQTEMIALNLIGGSRRLTEDLLRTRLLRLFVYPERSRRVFVSTSFRSAATIPSSCGN